MYYPEPEDWESPLGGALLCGVVLIALLVAVAMA